MPRAHRYILPGQTYHITHRCHDRAFLLRFAKDREHYRTMMRERALRGGVAVLGYCLTSNHVHLLLKVRDGGLKTLSRFMQALAGDFAQAYNLRKERSGAFWGDRYHAVMIDGGAYLWRCLRYIDLNMVRAGVVTEPAAWDWCGYQEVVGRRKRYRVVDLEEVADSLAPGKTIEEVAPTYAAYVAEGLRARELVREAMWTESIGVGSEHFVRDLGASIDGRMNVAIESESGNAWVAREERGAYSCFSPLKNGSKGSEEGLLSSQVIEALE